MMVKTMVKPLKSKNVEKEQDNDLVKIKVSIKGVTPLLMAAFKPDMLKSRCKDDTLPRDQAEMYAYRKEIDNPESNLIIPSECIFASIKYAGRYDKLGKKQISTAKNSVLSAVLRIIEPYADLGTNEYEVDPRSCVVPNGGRIMVYRPRLDKWETSFTCVLNTALRISNHTFTMSLLNKLIVDAGRVSGLCAHRPSCNGQMGTFMVTEFKQIT